MTPAPNDPRPDIRADSAVWTWLLSEAHAVDGEDPNGLYGALSALRACGARLEVDGRELKLKPDPEQDESAFRADAAFYLGPHLTQLKPLLSKAIHALPPAGTYL